MSKRAASDEDASPPPPLKRARGDDLLLAQLDRLSAAPLGLHEGEHLVQVTVDGGRGLLPAEDGMIRDPRTGDVKGGYAGDAPYGPRWIDEWFHRERALHDSEDYEFIELCAGELNRKYAPPFYYWLSHVLAGSPSSLT